jgi:hypothetical protein
VLSFLGTFAADETHHGFLAGGAFVVGTLLAVRYVQRSSLLPVVVSPPLLFAIALVIVKAVTATGSLLTSTVGGTVVTLGNLAPWLFGGMAAVIAIACVRGLPANVRELRAGLRGDRPTADSRQTRRP